MKAFIVCCLALILFSCDQSNKSDSTIGLQSSGDLSGDMDMAGAENDFDIEAPRSMTPSTPPQPQLLAYADEQDNQKIESKTNNRKLVRSAQIDIKVENYDKARQQLNEMVAQYQAEIRNEAQNQTSDGYRYHFSIRVLPSDFDAFLSKLERIASFVYGKSISVDDVTRQYVDLETRLASKRAVIAQYRSLLQSAKNVEDVLAVSDKLNEEIEEMESTEAQLRVLKDQVQFSTIELTIFDESVLPNVERANFWGRVGEGIFNGWQLLLNLMIGLVTIWPVVLIMAVIFWATRKYWQKRKLTPPNLPKKQLKIL
ncbi:MAG: DUF4349 domain-containing protein [Saprospiraceae bacterium]|nr:DUF4349 domain-containing protein [Saprospiraceae bacterium]